MQVQDKLSYTMSSSKQLGSLLRPHGTVYMHETGNNKCLLYEVGLDWEWIGMAC